MKLLNIIKTIVVLFICSSIVCGQSFYSFQRESNITLTTGIGISKYFGELSNDRSLGDFNPAISIGTEVSLLPKVSLRGELLYYRISATDSDLPDNDSRKNRNLSFRSNNLEVNLQAVFPFLKPSYSSRESSKVQPYVVGGIGVTFINPQAELNGRWYYLKELKTEGVDYSNFVLVIPAGAGISHRIQRNLTLSVEFNYRFTLSDYLDDVSTTYLPIESFIDPIAAQLSDRRPEIGFESAEPGSIRGNSGNNDGYFIMSLRAKWSISGQNTPIRRNR